MPRATALISSLTSGELSPLLDMRVDVKHYRNGANKVRNALVMPHGGCRKRPGTKHIFPMKSNDTASLLVPFQFNTEQAYVLEFGSSFVRVFKDGGVVATPGSPSEASSPSIESITETESSSGTSHAVAMPDTVAEGDLLIAFIVSVGSGSVATPSGWAKLGSGWALSVYAKVADGDEDGASVDFATSSSQPVAAQVYRILSDDWYGDLTDGVAIGAFGSGHGANPSAPRLDAPWGLNKNLWVAAIGYSWNRTKTLDPTGYTAGDWTKATGSANYAIALTAYRAADESSEKPGSFLLNGSSPWDAVTVAIRPATPETAEISAITQANPGVVTMTAEHGLSDGDQIILVEIGGMTELNGRRFTVSEATSTTFELGDVDTTNYTAYTSGGVILFPVDVDTAYLDSELPDLSFAQSADTLFISHPSHPIRKLTRSSHTSWTLTDADISNGPFRSINGYENHILTVAVTGSASVSGITKANPAVVTTTVAHGFEEGCHVTFTSVGGMTEVNSNSYVCRNVTSTTFELWNLDGTKVDSSGFTTYTSSGTATISKTAFGTISPGSKVTLTASKDLFQSDHVGALFRLWEPGKTSGVGSPEKDATLGNNDLYTSDGKVYGVKNLTTDNNDNKWEGDWSLPKHESGVVRILDVDGTEYHDAVYLHDSSCVLEILTYSSATSVTARVVRNHIPKSVVDNGTSLWEEGAWSEVRGYPGVITFHESRLWAAASTGAPQTIWASRSGSFEDFQDGADDDRAIIYEIASDKVDAIRWINSGKVLMFGTSSAEYAAASSSQNEALTPSNVRIVRQTPYGSSPARPLRVSNAILFGQRQGDPDNAAKRIRELTYSFEVDAFVAPDLTIISEHITGTGITEMAYQAEPNSVAWCVREDGKLASLTYEREQEVAGWSLQELGGTDAKVERVCVIPGPDGDELWLGVARTIDGETVRHIEVLTSGLRDDLDKEDAVYLDSALTYEGDETSTISGLWHLEGETVYALVDGSKQGPFTVEDGGITLTSPGELVHVGLRYKTIIETVDLEAAAAAGTAKSRAKKISEVWPSMHRSLGGRIGSTENRMYDIVYRTDTDLFGSSPALKTGLIRFGFPGGFNRRAYIRFEHEEPYPFTVLGIAAEISTSG